MARPATRRIAVRKAQALLIRSLPGSRRGTVRKHVDRAGRIAAAIWERWQVGPYQWRVKHLRWYLSACTRNYSSGTRYHYWLTIRTLVYGLGREETWLQHLKGPWLRPTGDASEIAPTGRPAKLPQAAD